MIRLKQKITLISILLITFSLPGYFLVKKIESGGFEKELVPIFTQVRSEWKGQLEPLINSRWRQDTLFAYYSPNHELLGCWSIAFAQVLAFNKLQPTGRVTYTTSSGVSIDEELIPVDWNKIAPVIDSTTPLEDFFETARYCYQSAMVLQKDFGTGDYKDLSIIPREVSEHFHCVVTRHDTAINKTIRMEITQGRPVVAYFDDILAIKILTNGHAALFDGIAQLNDKLLVHANFGWGGKSDGWYDLRSLSSERKLKYIFTIRKTNSIG